MRTTVDLPDPLFRELKAFATRNGSSLKVVIRHAVEAELGKSKGHMGHRVKFPVLPSRKPESLNLTNAEIKIFLPDVNVWLALATQRYVHARIWFGGSCILPKSYKWDSSGCSPTNQR
jgi:hypothetical protein